MIMKHFILLFCFLGCLAAPAHASPLHAPAESAAPVSPAGLDPELMHLLCEGAISQLDMFLGDFSCTLSAELSYNGVAIKLSITAKTCDEAGAGLAQAVKAFYREVAKT